MNNKPTLAVYTLGCRANQFDSESIVAQFKNGGFSRVPEFSKADVHVINTCTVTNTGDYKGRQLIKKVLKQKNGKVVVTGCSAQQDSEILSSLGVDLVVDNANKNEIYEHYSNHEFGDIVYTNIKKIKEFKQTPIDNFGEKTRAHLKIQDGCNQYCTYCIIPFVRGRSRSIDPISALEQLQILIQKGYKEIVLTGIHVGYYDSNNLNFTNLLKQILTTEGDFRIRLSSIEPSEVNPELMKLFEDFPNKLCRHLHIAIQSASDPILKNMKRTYDVNFLKKTFNALYTIDPNFGIGLDVIVGFPGETDEQFEQTCEFIKSYPVSYGHVFRYSSKKGTPASIYNNQIPEKIKKERSEIIRDLINVQERKYLLTQENLIHEIILENSDSGCSQYFTHVKLLNSSSEYIEGSKIRVKLSGETIKPSNSKFNFIIGQVIA